MFGINSGVSNVIRLHLDGDMPVDADLDLSDVFKDFTADGGRNRDDYLYDGYQP